MEDENKPSILIVDDDYMIREIIKVFLDKAGYRIAGEADNGDDAVKQYITHTPDLVLLDINMPKLDGIETLKNIQKINPYAKVLMVSAEATLNKVKQAMEYGASGFLVKPITYSAIHEKIEKCFKKKGDKYIWKEEKI